MIPLLVWRAISCCLVAENVLRTAGAVFSLHVRGEEGMMMEKMETVILFIFLIYQDHGITVSEVTKYDAIATFIYF